MLSLLHGNLPETSKAVEMFSEADVKDLLGLLPSPEECRTDAATLLRTASGDHLIRSDQVLKSFNNLIAEAKQRISIRDLPRLLDIADADWLFKRSDIQIIYSENRQEIVPLQGQERLRLDLTAALNQKIYTHKELCTQSNVDRQGLENLLKGIYESLGLEEVVCQSTTYVATARLLNDVRSTVREKLRQAQDSASSTRFEGLIGIVSQPLLRHIVEDVLRDSDANVRGQIASENGEAVFIPDSVKRQKDALECQKRQEEVQRALDALRGKGYFHSPAKGTRGSRTSDDLLDTVTSRYRDETGETLEDESNSSGIWLYTLSSLQKIQSDLGSLAGPVADRLYQTRSVELSVSWNAALFLEEAVKLSPVVKEEQYQRIVHSDDKGLKAAFEERIARLEDAITKALCSFIEQRLVCPVRLYSAGLTITATAPDQTLLTRLQEYVPDYLRSSFILPALAEIHEQRLIPNKSVSSDVSKFKEAVEQAKRIEDVESAMKKLTRKLKIDPPKIETVREVKTGILETRVKALGGSRKSGSDLLQNTVWIALAAFTGQAADHPSNGVNASDASSHEQALFISSGKDTSRVIKLYRHLTKDVSETWQNWTRRLEALRDVIKEGKDGEAEKEELRGIAKAAFEAWKGPS